MNTIQLILKEIDEIIERNNGIKNAIFEIDNLFSFLGQPPIEVVNHLKSIIQDEALTAWKNNDYKGLIVMATGVGKSRIPIKYITDNLNYSSIIVVPTEKLRDDNWKEEFIKVHESTTQYNSIERQCYASIGNIKELAFSFVLLDEAHNITENNVKFFENNSISDIMALTATVPTDAIKLQLLENLGLTIVYELSLDDAIKLRLVSPYEITIVETTLDNSYSYIKSGNKDKAFSSTESKAYSYVNEKIDKIEPRVNLPKPVDNFEGGFGYVDDSIGRQRGLTDKERKSLDNLIMKRMRIIYNSYAKLQVAKEIKKLISDKRTIFFCGSISQADEICDYSYHSKSRDDSSLIQFINEEQNQLSCVDSLNEGMNIPNVDCAVILQCNSKETSLIQRIGRIVRYRQGHVAKIIIIICKNTVDEKWLNSALSNLDVNKIKRISYSDLKVGNINL